MCILRDTFSFIPWNEHEVQHFLQWTHPVTNFIYTKKPERTMELKHFGHERSKMNFKERCIVNDYNRTVPDYFELPSDYFVLDLVTIVHTHLLKEKQSDGSEHFITHSQAFSELMEIGLRENFFKNIKLEKVSALELLNEVSYQQIIDAYVKWLLEDKKYRQEQIIVVENRSVHYWTDGNALFELDLDFRKENEILRKCYDYFEEICPNCHVIKMPCNVYADLNHHWGLSDLHFCIEYYEYLYSCIDAIVKEKNSKKRINQLYEDYSWILMDNIYRLMKNSFQYVCGKNLLQGTLDITENVGYIATKGTHYYRMINGYQEVGILSETVAVMPYGMKNAKFVKDGSFFYVNLEDCQRGYSGSGQWFGGNWQTMNATTEVQIKDSSIIVCHNGTNFKYQSQVIQVVENNEVLRGQSVVFSVYARVIKLNSEGRGGTLALINDNGYNKGIFLAYKSFTNSDWERISFAVRLPSGNDFHGLTVCLRAITSSNSCDGAVVEYRNPKLEIGAFPTAIN